MEANETGGTWAWSGIADPGFDPGPTGPVFLPVVITKQAMVLRADRPMILGVELDYDHASRLRLSLWDQEGHERCSTSNGSASDSCLLPLYERLGKLDWVAGVHTLQATEPVPFEVRLRITWWDPWQPQPVSFSANTELATDPLMKHVRIAVHPSGQVTREPALGVSDGGTLVTNEGEGILRSQDGGRSWQYVASASPYGSVDGDPWIWTDPETGRIFRLALQVACSWASISDDDGSTWEHVATAGCGQPIHHYQKLTTGPPTAGTATNGYPKVAYYSASQLIPDPASPDRAVAGTRTWASTSLDGGLSWGNAVEVHPMRLGCPVMAGPIVVDATGIAYSGGQYCDGIRIARSPDSGRTWYQDAFLDAKRIFGGLLGADLATDTEGGVYAVYHGTDGHAYLQIRAADGQWNGPLDVTPPGLKATTMAVIEAGLPGRVAIAFHGTTSNPSAWSSPNPSYAPDDATWHLYFVLANDALSSNPRFTSFQMTSPADPVQRGCIWHQGPAADEHCRNLEDFITMGQLNGQPMLGFVDGCLACETASESRHAWFNIATVEAFNLLGQPPGLSPDVRRPGAPQPAIG